MNKQVVVPNSFQDDNRRHKWLPKRDYLQNLSIYSNKGQLDTK